MNRIIRNIRLFCTTLLVAVMATSCADDFFEVPISESTNMETVFDNMYNADRALNAAYYLIPYNWNSAFSVSTSTYLNTPRIHQDLLASICDEAVSGATWTGAIKAYYGNGTVSPLTVGISAASADRNYVEHIFEEPYLYFRRAYLVLENLDKVSDATEEWKSRTTAEAKLLIAIGYYELTRRYGSVPYADGVLTAATADLKRITLKKQINIIDGLIEDAINSSLPARVAQEDQYFGKVTKATAHFLRSRLWLLAASPLFNTDQPYMDFSNPELICMMNPEGGAEWEATWQKAIDYTEDAIEYLESNGYALMLSNGERDAQATYTAATRDLDQNTEVVQFSRRTGKIAGKAKANTMYGRHMPPRQDLKSNDQTGYTRPTQNFVDMYRTTDGSTFDIESGANPWEKLDPRFHASIIYDNCSFGKVGDEPAYLYTQGNDVVNANGETLWRTGYYLRKFFHEDQYIDGAITKDPVYFYMRLPELYLNLAEACNELNPSDARIAENILKITGARDMPQRTFSSDKEANRKQIRDERAVELAFEDQRYFDVIRWKIAPETIGAEKWGVVRVGDKGSSTRTYKKEKCEEVRQTIWSNKRYLMPFPQKEINRDMGLIQNPGY